MKDLHTAPHPKLTLQGHTIATDGHDGIANVLFISIGAHVYLFKVHRDTCVPGAKLGQGGWLWASLTAPLRSLPGPLAAEASLLLLLTLTWLSLRGDWAHLQQLIGTHLNSTTQ